MKTETMSLCVLSLALVAGCDRFLYPPMKVESAHASKVIYTSAQEADDLAYINGQIKDLSKAGLGQSARDLNLELIQNSATMNAKLLYANHFINAFDSQLWNMTTDSRILNSPLKDTFQANAIKELAQHIPDLNVNHPPLSALATGNSMASFYAIVASLHEINFYRDIFRERLDATDESMLDLITSALNKEAALRSGEISYDDLSKTDVEILKRSNTFRYCLLIRHRFLPLLALGRLAQVNDGLFLKMRSFFTRAIPEFADLYTYQFDTQELDIMEGKGKHSLQHYEVVKKLNLVQIYYANELLDEAIASKEFLKSIKFKPKLDHKIEIILSNLKVNYSDVPNSGNNVVTEAKLELVDGFNQKIKELLAE